jgi:hypothetical protein
MADSPKVRVTDVNAPMCVTCALWIGEAEATENGIMGRGECRLQPKPLLNVAPGHWCGQHKPTRVAGMGSITKAITVERRVALEAAEARDGN